MRPATEKELRYAALIYHSAFDEELVDRNYNKQDIDNIIDLAQKKLYIDELHELNELGIDGEDWDQKPLH